MQEEGRRRPQRAAFLIAAGLAAVAVVIVVDMQRLTATGAYDQIGPTTVPYAVAGMLLLVAIGTAISGWRGTFPVPEPQAFGPVAIILAGLVAQVLLLRPAGFILSSAVMFVAVAFALGERRLQFTVPSALVLATLVWLVFDRLLKLTLPQSFLEGWLVPLVRSIGL